MHESTKFVFESIYYIVAAIAAIAALVVYYRNSELERAKWASTLYDRFYGAPGHKMVCNILDTTPSDPAVPAMVTAQSQDFTDYLNFFEYVGFLVKADQLDYSHIETLFGHYLGCMKRHPSVMDYITNRANSFEELHHLLLRTGP